MDLSSGTNSLGFFQEVVENLPQTVYETDDTGRLIYVNKWGFIEFGYTQEEFQNGINVLQTLVEGDRETALKNIKTIIQSRNVVPHEYTAQRKDGTLFPVIIYTSAYFQGEQYLGIRGIVVNIEELKKKEQALVEKEQTLSLFYQSIHDGFLQSDTDGRILITNPQMDQIYGGDSQELVGQNLKDFIIKTDCHRFFQTLLSGRAVEEVAIIQKDGQHVTVLVSSTIINSQHGQRIHSFFRDISELSRVRRKLFHMQDQFYKLVDNTPNAIIVHQDGKVVFANQSAVTLLKGRTQDDLLGKNVMEYVHPEDLPKVIERVRLIMENSELSLSGEEERFRCMDGAYITCEVYAIPFTFNDRPAIQVEFKDITDKKQLALEKEELQIQLLHSQKLEAVGTLAGGIAHDFNNLLTVIIANTELILKNKTVNQAHDLETILHAAKSAAGLTKRLLMFSRKQNLEKQHIYADTIIADLKKVLDRLLGEEFRIHIDLDAAKSVLFASASEIEHILVNLVVNARDAMPKGGRIIISSSEKIIENDEFPTIPPITGGKYYCLSVKDEGIGMDSQLASRIFDPFFTTKEVGQGSGLGLSTVYGIITRHQGGILLHTAPDQGSEFQLYFPVAEFCPLPQKISSSTGQHPIGRGRILLIEDDEDVRLLCTQMLEDHGYAVFAVPDLAQARKVFQDNASNLELIITDVRLPDGTGLDFAGHVQTLYPGLPILFISGYTHLGPEDLILEPFRREFLAKPFDYTSLLQAVRSVMTE